MKTKKRWIQVRGNGRMEIYILISQVYTHWESLFVSDIKKSDVSRPSCKKGLLTIWLKCANCQLRVVFVFEHSFRSTQKATWKIGYNYNEIIDRKTNIHISGYRINNKAKKKKLEMKMFGTLLFNIHHSLWWTDFSSQLTERHRWTNATQKSPTGPQSNATNFQTWTFELWDLHSTRSAKLNYVRVWHKLPYKSTFVSFIFDRVIQWFSFLAVLNKRTKPYQLEDRYADN